MVRLLSILLILGLLLSCSGEKKESTPGEDAAATKSAQSQPRQAIPDEGLSEFDELMQAKITPYFDAEGTVSEHAVAPGERFDVYVFGECNKMYSMSAAEYMLTLPKGMEVLAEAKSDSAVMTLGSYKTDFMISFRCAAGPKFMMMKYSCQVNDAFTGGEVETREGSIHNFVGFTLCDDARTMVKAQPGKALLTKK